CAVAQYCHSPTALGEHVTVAIQEDNSGICGKHGRKRQHSVLINVHELAQNPEGVRMGIPLATLIRLQTLNQCARLNGYSTETPPPNLPVEPSRRVTDREHIRGGGATIIDQHQLIDDMVKSRSQVMQTVSDHNTETQVRCG